MHTPCFITCLFVFGASCSLHRPPLGPTTAVGMIQQFQNPAAVPLGSYSTYASKRSGPKVSVREIPKNVQAPSSLPK